jgi:hydroxymethylbilane synthase
MHDPVVRPIIAALDHAPTTRATTAERMFLAALEGGCQVPIGAWHDGRVLHGLVAAVEGAPLLRGEIEVGDDPVAAGRALAARLRSEGADAILAGIRGGAAPAVAP